MKVKSKLSIVAFFSCCAVTCMGFANWVITQQAPMYGSSSGGVAADGAILSDDYIKFIEATTLNVNAGGFTDPGNQSKTILSGSFTATFQINLSNYCMAFANGAVTEIILKFAQTPVNNIFAYTLGGAAVSVYCNDFSNLITSADGSLSNGTFVTSLNMNGLAESYGTATFTLKYTFTFTDKNIYKTYIYNVFYPNGTNQNTAASPVRFAFDITIRG